ncbi:hypothetical protein BGZ52_008510 [Haplosporangium bisporale]|nr:hypothetical protein BGZ52_008510 [Haplosporangium bisporale]
MAVTGKRARTESTSTPSAKNIKDTVDQIRLLERQVAESKTHLNNLVTLNELCENASPKVIHAAMHALFRVFSAMVNKGELQKPKKAAAEDKKATVTLWLRDHYIQYLNRMCQILNYPEAGLQVPALKILMDLVKVESAFLSVQSGGHHFANDLYHRIVEALLNCSNMSQLLLSEFTEKYFGFYDDLRFYFLKDAAVVIDVALGTTGKNDKKAQAKKQKMGNRASPEKLSLMLENAFAIMETLKSMPTDDKELDEWWAGNPDPILMDFLTDSYNAGGAVSLLALKGLFILITEHNLDYPDFFHKLYMLFDRNLMHVKYRARFFSQVDIFLSSPLLPAQMIAAFIKRMARLALSSPPASIVIIIPFIYNLLKRHPTCMQLIHGSATSEENDSYNHLEDDPMKCNALQSSLWEMQTLQNHFAPNVSTLAKIFNEQFTKPSYNLEDFLDHTYATMFQNEVSKKRKADAALAVEAPKGLFVAAAEATADDEEQEDSIVPGWEAWEF